MLKGKLDKEAENCNAFSIELVPLAAKFVKEEISNAYVIEVEPESNGEVWCIIGADKESARNLFDTI